MATPLSRILKFDLLAAALVEAVIRHSARRFTILGPSGTGKTNLAREASELLTELGCGVVWLNGDVGRKEERYYPIRSTLRSGNVSNLFGKGAKILSGLAEDFLPMGRSTAKTIVSLLPTGSTSDKDASYSDIAREFSSLLGRMNKRQRVIIVADDIQYFDADTLNLLTGLFNNPTRSDDDFEISIVSTINTSAPLDGAPPPDPRGLTSTINVIELTYCQKNEFASVLHSLGLKNHVPQRTIDLLYDCSGGHLHLAKFIADELGGAELDNVADYRHIDLLHSVIQKRLSRVVPSSDSISSILSSAAHIGRSFTTIELNCLTGIPPTSLKRSLEEATELGFIENEGDAIRFSHEIIRTYFVKSSALQKAGFSEKYSNCLRILRPYDYFARCISLLGALRNEEAAVAYCQANIAEWRAGRFSVATTDKTSGLLERAKWIINYLEAMRQASLFLADGDFRAARSMIETIHDGFPELLLAERDYLLAEALLKDLGEAQSEQAKHLLEGWKHIKDREAELWCRMKLLLLLAHVQLSDFSSARNTEKEVAQFLVERRTFDPDADRQLNRLLALSEMHSSVEVSRKRLEQVCKHHESMLSDRGYTDLRDYYVALTNRSGNCITAGEFIEAIEIGAKALLICRDYPMMRLPAQWAAANNVIIAAILDGRMTSTEGARSLREVTSRFPNLDDDLILNSNIGAAEIISGDLDSALNSFALNDERLVFAGEIDPYYMYHTESNRAIALHLSGNPNGEIIWNRCAPLVPRLAPAARMELAYRHDCLNLIFDETTLGNPDAWDRRLSIIEESNSRFKRGGFVRGVLLSDLQIWSSF
ncbi:MAG: AAA family ATPase [Pseudomonadota bacterium]